MSPEEMSGDGGREEGAGARESRVIERAVLSGEDARVVSSAVGSVTADGDVEMTSSMAGVVNSKNDITLHQAGALAMLSAGNTSVQQGGALAIVGRSVEVENGGALSLVATDAHVKRGWIGFLVSSRANISEDSRVLIGTRAAIIIALGLVGGFAALAVAFVILAQRASSSILGRWRSVLGQLPHLPGR